jgi:hypothetical protein
VNVIVTAIVAGQQGSCNDAVIRRGERDRIKFRATGVTFSVRRAGLSIDIFALADDWFRYEPGSDAWRAARFGIYRFDWSLPAVPVRSQLS